MVRFQGTAAEKLAANAMRKGWEAACDIWQARDILDDCTPEDACYGDEAGGDDFAQQNLEEAFNYFEAALAKFSCNLIYEIIGDKYNPLHHELDSAYGTQLASFDLCEATATKVVRPGLKVAGRLSFRTVIQVGIPSASPANRPRSDQAVPPGQSAAPRPGAAPLPSASARPETCAQQAEVVASAGSPTAEGPNYEAAAGGGGCGTSTAGAAGAGASPGGPLELLLKYRQAGGGGADADRSPPTVLSDGVGSPTESPSHAARSPQMESWPAGLHLGPPLGPFDQSTLGCNGAASPSMVGCFTPVNGQAFSRSMKNEASHGSNGVQEANLHPQQSRNSNFPSPAAFAVMDGAQQPLWVPSLPQHTAFNTPSAATNEVVPAIAKMPLPSGDPRGSRGAATGDNSSPLSQPPAPGATVFGANTGVQGRAADRQMVPQLHSPVLPSPSPPSSAGYAVPGPGLQSPATGPVPNGLMPTGPTLNGPVSNLAPMPNDRIPNVMMSAAGSEGATGDVSLTRSCGIGGSGGRATNGAPDAAHTKAARPTSVAAKVAAETAAHAVRAQAAAAAAITAQRQRATGPGVPSPSGPSAAAPSARASAVRGAAAPAPSAMPEAAVAATGAAPRRQPELPTAATPAPIPSIANSSPSSGPTSTAAGAGQHGTYGGVQPCAWPPCPLFSDPHCVAAPGQGPAYLTAPHASVAVAAAPPGPLTVQPCPYGSIPGRGWEEMGGRRKPRGFGNGNSNGGVRSRDCLETEPSNRPTAPQRSESSPTRPSAPPGRQPKPLQQGPARGSPGPGPSMGSHLPMVERGGLANSAAPYHGEHEEGYGHGLAGGQRQGSLHLLAPARYGEPVHPPHFKSLSYYERYRRKHCEATVQDFPSSHQQHGEREVFERCLNPAPDGQRRQTAPFSAAASSERSASSTGSSADVPAAPASKSGSEDENLGQRPSSVSEMASATSAGIDDDLSSSRSDADGGECGEQHDYKNSKHGRDGVVFHGREGGFTGGNGHGGGEWSRGKGCGDRRRGDWGGGGCRGGRGARFAGNRDRAY